jgi:hypothetical protein
MADAGWRIVKTRDKRADGSMVRFDECDAFHGALTN